MFNADGSEGALCGNALRCMAMWLHQSGICEKQFVIAMGGRLIPATIHQSDPQQRSAIVRVQIGSPRLQEPGAVDRSSYVRETVLPGVSLPELIKPVLHVSMGNPHTVLFVRSLRDVDVIQLGSQIEQHPVFPDRTNVEFVEIADGLVKVRVWERGSGETMACGSGACAVAVAGTCCGLFPETTETTVSMRGGDLRVDWTADNNIFLTGPAAESFRGIIHDENV
jgi:diaminopimelate epimerase